ncbi:metallophosphoesterase [Neorhizobium sp. CSC1952]|uniref:metallophosphoesterase n=1 Tax=Neorhizobium sp. CSC1952 TaxID=2978974 RepID=UPI0025A6271B|nr:metallophosphoesterase [Rhizobium sp. CSC1952]WJR66325.1 metallophosphoesterase [Rhizobium sp. CSC1952]
MFRSELSLFLSHDNRCFLKAWIVSDLHVAHAERLPANSIEIPDADICLCAGDVAGFIQMSLDFLVTRVEPIMPVLMVLGNHDCYGNTIDNALATARNLTEGTRISVLENETKVFGDVRVVGATLWTDFEIEWGIKEEVSLPDRRKMAIDVCKRYMVDFREIFRSDWHETGMPGLLMARELITRHVTSRAFIEAQLAKPFHGTTVVLTHHAPSPRSLDPKFHGQETNAAFASDLTPTIRNGKPDLWVHGHIHRFIDYYEGSTRIVCNPRGYPYEREKNGFQAGFVINI